MTGQPHVAVVAVGDPESPRTWSGTTTGVLASLRELGVRAQAVDLSLPAPLERFLLVGASAATRNRYDAEAAALTAWARGKLARSRLDGDSLAGVIQIGTTFALPKDVRYVTLEDMTVRQAGVVHPVFSRMSQVGIERWERRRRAIYDRAQMCAATSHWVASSLVGEYGLSSERVAVVGLGANHLVQAVPSRRDWSSPRFLFVGIDWERKGGPLLLRAFARLRAQFPQASLDLVGGHPPVRAEGVTGHGMRSRAVAGDRALIAELFARATCLAMPSLVEPFGIVHIEAASAGVPSIGSAVGGARDVIDPPHGGLVVAPGDEDALLTAMRQLSEPQTARSMGVAARARALEYTWSKVSQRLLRALGVPVPDRRALAGFL